MQCSGVIVHKYTGRINNLDVYVRGSPNARWLHYPRRLIFVHGTPGELREKKREEEKKTARTNEEQKSASIGSSSGSPAGTGDITFHLNIAGTLIRSVS